MNSNHRITLDIRAVGGDPIAIIGVFREVLSVLHDHMPQQSDSVVSPSVFEIQSERGGTIRTTITLSEADAPYLTGFLQSRYPDIHVSPVPAHPSEIFRVSTAVTARKNLAYPIRIDHTTDPFEPLVRILREDSNASVRIGFLPVPDIFWKRPRILDTLLASHPETIERVLLSRAWDTLVWITLPFVMLFSIVSHTILFLINPFAKRNTSKQERTYSDALQAKLRDPGYRVSIEVLATEGSSTIGRIGSALSVYSLPDGNTLEIAKKYHPIAPLPDVTHGSWILSTGELAGLIHPVCIMKNTDIPLPETIENISKKAEEAQHPALFTESVGTPEITPLGYVRRDDRYIRFGVLPSDRARHVYIVGKTGMGKTTLLQNMIYDDIVKGRGVAVIDPHGDLSDTLLEHIPRHRTNDVILFDASDFAHPIAFNMFENVPIEFQPIVASGIISIFKKIFGEVSWGPRLEYILRNTILTLLQVPDSTLLSIPLLLTHRSYRARVVERITDPFLQKFWKNEFDVLDTRQMNEAISPILNKVGQFLSSPILRNILAQVHNPFSLRWIMDNRKILIMKLPKGKIGEDSGALLGSMFITKFQIDAMSRADTTEGNRPDFFLYVDEFQNFATDSFATILSEARKYHLHLTLAHQYVEQIPETLRKAIFGNVGTMLAFQVGPLDARLLAQAMDERTVTPSTLTGLRRYDLAARIVVDGMPAPTIIGTLLPPLATRMKEKGQERDVIVRVSREKYGKSRAFVEKKITEFSESVSKREEEMLAEERQEKEKRRRK